MDDINQSWKLVEDNIKGKRKQDRYNKLNKEHKINETKYEKIQNGYFSLLKNCTILSGTIFASSIALATGKDVNNPFVIGELLLLISTMSGALYLWSQLRSEETFYFLQTSWQMETDLITNKDLMEDFEKEQIEKSIKDYKRLSNPKSILYYVLKIIKVDWLPTIFFFTLFMGLVFIWVSLFYQPQTYDNSIHNFRYSDRLYPNRFGQIVK